MRSKVLLAIIFTASVLFGGNTSSLKITFKENKGQVSDQFYKARLDLLFSASVGEMNCYFRNSGISYQLYRVDTWKEEKETHRSIKSKTKSPDQITVYRIDINWLNANNNAVVEKVKPLEGYDNYYLASCPNGAKNVKSYSKLIYKNIYSGIDLQYYEEGGNLKYDYIVKPRSDYKNIKFQINGATNLNIKPNGDLCINTPLGEITEKKPVVFQNGKTLKSSWELNGNVVSFNIENVNPNFELIIDPPVLVRIWGTFYGGSGDENYTDGALDNLGNVFICGETKSPSSPLIYTSGAFQTVLKGTSDVFLAKFNGSGVRQWGTYYGDMNDEWSGNCSTDNSGNVYLCGSTRASSITTNALGTAGSHQSTYAGGTSDGFLAKFDPSGNRIWGTYYGCTGIEDGYNCATDISGNVYLCGMLMAACPSSTAIATPGAFQTVFSGSEDSYLVKFNSSGVRQWATLYGGNVSVTPDACTTDALGNVIMVGRTSSPGPLNAISTPGCHQYNYDNTVDGFIVKFDATGNRLWGTYYGGSNTDYATSCTTDASNNIYVGGSTTSTNAITSPGCFKPIPSFYGDNFLAKFNALGVRQWATYYGDTNGAANAETSCATDNAGNVYFVSYTSIIGATTIGSSCATSGCYQDSVDVNGGGYLVKFNGLGNRIWGTYYGHRVGAAGLWGGVTNTGNIYVIGVTPGGATAFPGDLSTLGSQQSNPGGGILDGFIMKFYDSTYVPQTTGLSNFNQTNGLMIYPNPVSSTLWINSTHGEFENSEIEIINCLGQTVLKSSYKSEIDVSDLPAGSYLLKTTTIEQQRFYYKFIKQ